MDGEPIWIVPLGSDPDWTPHWYIFHDGCVGANSITRKGVTYFYYPKTYGKNWLAYHHKRKEV